MAASPARGMAISISPESGAAPPPFKEKIPTFRVKVVGGSVFVHPRPNPPGTYVQPAQIESGEAQPR
jgi:hypothetical protein